MKDYLQQLPIDQLINLRENLKDQLLDDIFGENPEIKFEFKDANEAIYIKKIYQALETKNLDKMKEVYIEVKEAFNSIDSKHISEEMISYYKKISAFISIMSNNKFDKSEFLKKVINGEIILNII